MNCGCKTHPLVNYHEVFQTEIYAVNQNFIYCAINAKLLVSLQRNADFTQRIYVRICVAGNIFRTNPFRIDGMSISSNCVQWP